MNIKNKDIIYLVGNILKDHIKFHKQLWGMAVVDLKRKFSGAALGWSWAIIKPAFMLFIYWFVLTVGLKTTKKNGIDENIFLTWLVVGLAAWFFINDGIRSGMGSMNKYKFLINKMKFPVNIIPSFTIISDLLVHLILIIIAFLLLGVSGNLIFSVYWVQLPLYLILSIMFLWALSQVLAPLTVLSKDFSALMKTFLQGLFWMSGILFNIESIGSKTMRWLLKINPVTFLVEGYRHSICLNEWIWQRPNMLCAFIVEMIIILWLGLFVGKRTRKELADVI